MTDVLSQENVLPQLTREKRPRHEDLNSTKCKRYRPEQGSYWTAESRHCKSDLKSSEMSSDAPISPELVNYKRLVFMQRLMNLDLSRFKVLANYLKAKFTQWKNRDELRFRALHLPKEIQQKPPRRFLSLSEEDLREVDSILTELTTQVLVEIDGIQLTPQLLSCLRPSEWLNDEVINAYMSLLNSRSRRLTEIELTSEQILNRSRPLKCHFWNTFFYPALTGETSTGKRDGYDYSRVKKWSLRKKIDIFALDLVFFPLHIHKVHWALGCVDIKSRFIFYFDSLGNGNGFEFYEHVKDYLMDEHLDKKGAPLPTPERWLWAGNNFACSTFSPVSLREVELKVPSQFSKSQQQRSVSYSADIPLQSNGSDCGVFVCQYAEGLSICRYPFDFDSSDIHFRRKLMVHQLIRGGIS